MHMYVCVCVYIYIYEYTHTSLLGTHFLFTGMLLIKV